MARKVFLVAENSQYTNLAIFACKKQDYRMIKSLNL